MGFLESLFSWCYPLFKKIGMNDTFASYGSMLINIVVLSVLTYLLYIVFRLTVIALMAIVARKTKTKFDDLFISSKTAKYISHLIPLFFVYKSVPEILKDFVYWDGIFAKMIGIYIVLLVLWIIRTLLNALKTFLKSNPKYFDKPIESYIQVLMIVLWGFGIIFMILYLFDTSVTQLIATFGAISAIIILIFRDAILGFAASIQVSLNDLVRIGDTITVDKFGADGEVVEINLSTVLIRNFDHTITTIPTYSLFSNSFRNWRGMYHSEGRRIKRFISIRSNSIRFLNTEELASFAHIHLISKYIATKVVDQRNYNEQHLISPKDSPLNGVLTTNLTVFRKYVTTYLEQHPSINQNLIVMCRQLQPTPQGVPIEIYAYSKVTAFEPHEQLVAEIMEQILASVLYFDLQLFEQPAGKSPLD